MKKKQATCREIVLTTLVLTGACALIMNMVSQRGSSAPVVQQGAAQVAEVPDASPEPTPTAEGFNAQVVRDLLRTTAGEVVAVEVLEGVDLYATVGYVPANIDDAPLALDEIGYIAIQLAETPLDGVYVILGRDAEQTLGIATIFMADVRAHLAGDMTRDQMQARIRFDALTGQAAPTAREQVATIPTWVRAPGNCATAVARGLTAAQAAQYPQLDRDRDGAACYGD